MNARPVRRPRQQRGIATVMVVVLLIAGVLFILTQTLGIVATRSLDNAQDLDSTAALMLAESGLQRAQAIVGTAAGGGTMTNSDCTAIGTSGPFAVGRGTFGYGPSVSSPPSCGITDFCDTCTITANGTVGSATRTLRHTYEIGVVNGVAGKGQTVTMVLKNGYDVPAVALFNLGWKRQGTGGNAKTTITVCPVGCDLRWNLESSSGNPSVGGMGTLVDIAPLTLSKVVTQNISFSRDFVEVGALFPGFGTTYPQVVGGFWRDAPGTPGTASTSGADGATNSGVAGAGGGACNLPDNPPGTSSQQTCTQWCTAADTLVFGFSGRSDTAVDQLTGVTFNNVPLLPIVHFPETDGSIANASGKVYSEIWYAANPEYVNYTLTGTGAGSTSYPSAAKATAGANIVLSANMSNNDTTMTVASLADPNSRICLGDTLHGDPNINGAVITAPAGCNTTGVYTFSPKATGNVNKNNVVVWSTTLRIQGAHTGDTFSAGATNTPGVSIASGPDGSGNYTLSVPVNMGTTSFVTQGNTSTTIRVPSGSGLPAIGSVIAVYSPAVTGSIPAGSTVTSTGVNSFTLSGSAPGIAAGTTPLVGATVCGGICALFNDPSNIASTTAFSVTKSAGTSQWAGGFVCLKGVDASKITRVQSTTLKTRGWQEVVQ